jgi:hypothetical protein
MRFAVKYSYGEASVLSLWVTGDEHRDLFLVLLDCYFLSESRLRLNL